MRETTLSLPSIEENLKFMVLEVLKQIDDTSLVLQRPSKELIEKIYTRDDYIDVLKNLIENKCFHLPVTHDKKLADFIKAVDITSNNLEHIGDFAVSVIKQTRFLNQPDFIVRYPYNEFFQETSSALKLLRKGLFSRDLQAGLKICRSEFKIDDLYKIMFQRILEELSSGQQVQNLVTSLIIFGYLERMGDALLNIGEAIISTALGEKLKITQYNSFQEAVLSSGVNMPEANVSFRSMGETRSGCRIERVSSQAGDDKEQGLIFKEGNLKKILKEKENIEAWQNLAPGLVPKVFGFHQAKQNAALLLEYIAGRNLKDLILDEESALISEAMDILKNQMSSIWHITRKEEPLQVSYTRQIASRLEDVYKVHPDFKSTAMQIGPLEIPSVSEFLNELEKIEKQIAAPFSVLTHGDFNIDNVLYDASQKRIYFVDLYRSGQADYVQDTSVFLVSNFRIPVIESPIRQRLNNIIVLFYRFASDFAVREQDETFAVRLTLGLIRSFITSTRFEFQQEFAKVMFLRSIYLMEKLLHHRGKSWNSFKFPEEVLTF